MIASFYTYIVTRLRRFQQYKRKGIKNSRNEQTNARFTLILKKCERKKTIKYIAYHWSMKK